MADILLILVILTNLRLLATSSMASLIVWVAMQGVVLGAFAIVFHASHPTLSMLLIALLAVVLKGWAFPKLLFRAMRTVSWGREVEPYVGYVSSLLIGLAVLILSLWLGSRLPLAGAELSRFVIPAALFSIFVGLFLIVSRKKAIAQVVGYLVMENGMFVLGVGCFDHTLLLVKLGVLLDLLVAVFLMAIMIHNIHRAFKHIDTHELSRLRG